MVMSKYLIGSLIGYFRRTQFITRFGKIYKNYGRLWMVSDCEELVGGQA